mmetsp:Transcript_20226/g.35972  ORF Transcript_20226/g.35972 Transcript_20226/m.35972 type:complete len:114 (+) Transcript_20226:2096-2437(+)
MFKLKEVAPIDNKSEFWTTHVSNLRSFNSHKAEEEEGDDSVSEAYRVLREELEKRHNENTVQNYDSLLALSTQKPQRTPFDEKFYRPPSSKHYKPLMRATSKLAQRKPAANIF